MTNTLTLAFFLAHFPAPGDFILSDAQYRALAIVESGDNPHKRGRKRHEVGRTQILPVNWKRFGGGKPWTGSQSDIDREPEVARKIAAWNYLQFQRDHRRYPQPVPLVDESVYCAWNLGYPACRKAGWRLWKMPRLTQRKAREFAAKVKELEGK